MTTKLNVDAVLAQVDTWSPQVVGVVNDYDVKAANLAGEFTDAQRGRRTRRPGSSNAPPARRDPVNAD